MLDVEDFIEEEEEEYSAENLISVASLRGLFLEELMWMKQILRSGLTVVPMIQGSNISQMRKHYIWFRKIVKK